MVELGVKSVVYRKKYGFDVPKRLWDDWMELFVKGMTASYPLNDELGLLLDPEYVDRHRPHSVDELITQAMLNCVDIAQYLDGAGKWSERELVVKMSARASDYSRVLGVFVYDVFTSVNALPAPLVNVNKTVFGPVVSVFDGELDDASTRRLCDAIAGRRTLPVTAETALRYCLSAYHTETDNGRLIQILEDDDDDAAATAPGGPNSNYFPCRVYPFCIEFHL